MTTALLFALIDKGLDIAKLVIEGQPQDVKAELWRRHLDETEWMHKLMAKLSDKIEAQIDKQA